MRNIYKYIIVFAILMIGMLINCNNVEASSVTLTKSKTVNQGESVTITASVTSGSWNLVLEGAGQSKKLVGNTETEANETASTSITFTASNVGTYKFTLKGDVTDYVTDITEDINQETVITVKAPEPPKQEENTNQGGTTNSPAEDTNKPSGGDSSNNNTTGGNDTSNNTGSSNSGSGTTAEQPEQKPEQNPEPKPETKPAEKSSNNKLKNLGIRPNDFSGFKANTTKYNVSVPNDVTEVEVYAEAQDSKAKISGTGKIKLEVGSNQAKVVCTAEDGTTKTYVINITRKEVEKAVEKPVEEPPVQEEPEKIEEPKETESEIDEEIEELPKVIMGLSKLEAIGKTSEGKDIQIELSPAFDENTQEYVMAVPLSVEDIAINAVAVNGNARIEVMGNKNLVEGENLITVIVKIGQNTKVYEIKVNKVAVEEGFLSEELIMQLGVIAAVITIIIVAITVIIIMIVKNSKKEKAPRRAMSSQEIINGILEREAQQAKDENKTE